MHGFEMTYDCRMYAWQGETVLAAPSFAIMDLFEQNMLSNAILLAICSHYVCHSQKLSTPTRCASARNMANKSPVMSLFLCGCDDAHHAVVCYDI